MIAVRGEKTFSHTALMMSYAWLPPGAWYSDVTKADPQPHESPNTTRVTAQVAPYSRAIAAALLWNVWPNRHTGPSWTTANAPSIVVSGSRPPISGYTRPSQSLTS